MGTGPVPVPILQIHASRKCNLSCPHCYSESSPSAADELPVEVICELIEDAAELGYRGIAFSGGEPLVYPGLVEVLSYAKALGLHTSVTTNGTLAFGATGGACLAAGGQPRRPAGNAQQDTRVHDGVSPAFARDAEPQIGRHAVRLYPYADQG